MARLWSGGRFSFFKPYLKKNSTELGRSRRWKGSRRKTPSRMYLSNEIPRFVERFHLGEPSRNPIDRA